MVNNRRSELDIISEILVLSRKGAKKTEILYRGNLSYTQLQSYLPFLLEKDVLEERIVKNSGSSYRSYRITEKGLGLLEDIRRVMVYLG